MILPSALLARLDEATRLTPADATDALARRSAELPASVKTPAQLLGRRSTGCEGTHGVFRARDRFFAAFPGLIGYGPLPRRAARITRAVVSHPAVAPAIAGWAARFVRRGGGVGGHWRRIQPTTFVLHRFMDATATAAGGNRPTSDRVSPQ